MQLEPAPDGLFPSDNLYGIPRLLLSMQADCVDVPVLQWGQQSRNTKKVGTYHFYTDDYRFNRLWKEPNQILTTGVPTVCEPNFSVFDTTPPAQALNLIYQKRWLCRYWQENGVRIFVDLNVSRRMTQENLLGVPSGWRAFSTRAYPDRPHDLEHEIETAYDIAGSDEIIFLVYAGGRKAREICQYYGLIWIPDYREDEKNRRQSSNLQLFKETTYV